MQSSSIIQQTPYHKVIIRDPTEPKDDNIIFIFSLSGYRELQSYQWQLSLGDVNGSFSLTFFPECKEKREISFFEKIPLQAIVEIYEAKAGDIIVKPIFTGIVNNKKYVLQASESGASRRLLISGTAITGLVSQFYLNLDPIACATSIELQANASVTKSLNIKFESNMSMREVIDTIWLGFISIAKSFTNSKICEYIDSFLDGNKVFSVDDGLKCFYPLANVFTGESTQNFFDIIANILPSPICEIYPYTKRYNGKMHIKIRQAQFSKEDWAKLVSHTIKPIEVKSISLSASDSEVYTAFYSYLDGYPKQAEYLLKQKMGGALADKSNADKSNSLAVVIDKDRFNLYGYRPLICHFRGFATGSTQDDIDSQLNIANGKLQEWFSSLPLMLKGSIDIASIYEDNSWIMPGEKVEILGGEFYVEGVSHSWNYGSGADINLSVSRGGSYTSDGSFCELKNFTSALRAFETGVK